MKLIIIFVLIVIFSSCSQSSSEKDIISIDPRTVQESEILLSEIAEDISYISLDNQFPIGIIYSCKFVNNFIYAAIKGVGVVRFTNNGKFDKQYGKIGRGPGEYVYCLSFVVDENNETVYVMDHKIDDVEIYNNEGVHIGNFKLPVDDEGFDFSELEFFNSYIVAAQYLNMGRGKFNWIIFDTIGNKLVEKVNPYPIFKGRLGGLGGLFKYKDKLGYWDEFKDTVYHISPDLSYDAVCIFSPGPHRLPRTSAPYNDPNDFFKIWDKFLMSQTFFETNNFFVYLYYFNKTRNLAFIYKKNDEVKALIIEKENGGITNDIDNGLPFIPETYFEKDNKEYLISIVNPFALKAYIASQAFKNSTTKYPEKKKALEKLANSLNENDNPVLMLVRLKE